VIVREAENPGRQSTGDDLILIPAAIHQTDIEAVNTATDITVCADDIVAFFDLEDPSVTCNDTEVFITLKDCRFLQLLLIIFLVIMNMKLGTLNDTGFGMILG